MHFTDCKTRYERAAQGNSWGSTPGLSEIGHTQGKIQFTVRSQARCFSKVSLFSHLLSAHSPCLHHSPIMRPVSLAPNSVQMQRPLIILEDCSSGSLSRGRRGAGCLLTSGTQPLLCEEASWWGFHVPALRNKEGFAPRCPPYLVLPNLTAGRQRWKPGGEGWCCSAVCSLPLCLPSIKSKLGLELNNLLKKGKKKNKRKHYNPV